MLYIIWVCETHVHKEWRMHDLLRAWMHIREEKARGKRRKQFCFRSFRWGMSWSKRQRREGSFLVIRTSILCLYSALWRQSIVPIWSTQISILHEGANWLTSLLLRQREHGGIGATQVLSLLAVYHARSELANAFLRNGIRARLVIELVEKWRNTCPASHQQAIHESIVLLFGQE